MFLGVPWYIAGSISIVVSIVYFFIWPKELVNGIPGWQVFILRWFHSLVWILLAISFFLRYTNVANKKLLVDGFSYGALILYAIFMLTFAYHKFF